MSLQERSIEELITYRIDEGEGVAESIVSAFRSIDFRTESQPTVLNDWINCDCLDELGWDENESLRVSTTIWSHPIRITPDAVTIYPARTDT